MQISLDTPGLIHGIGIQQIDLIQMGHGASLATEVDTHVRVADRRHERLQRGAARRQRRRQPGFERQSQPGRDQHGGGRDRLDPARRRLRAVDEHVQDLAAAGAHGRAHARSGAGRSRSRDRRTRARRRSRRDRQRGAGVQDQRDRAGAGREGSDRASRRSRDRAPPGRSREGARRRDADPGDEPARRRIAPPRRRRSDVPARPALPDRIRQDPRRLQRRGEQADGDGARGGGEHQRDPRRLARNLHLVRRSLAPHRTAGGAARRGGGGARRDHRHAEEVGRRGQAGGGRGRQRRRQRQEGRGRRQAGGRGDGRDRQIVGRRSARSSASSTRSRSRPICWRSTPASRRRAPATPAAASRWSPRKCARSPSVRRRPPRRSRA